MLCNNIKQQYTFLSEVSYVSFFFEHILICFSPLYSFYKYIDDFGHAIVRHYHGNTRSNAHILYILSVLNIIIPKSKCFAL